MGGDTEFVEVSRKQKTGREVAGNHCLLVADLRENCAANRICAATGTVIWNRVWTKGRGQVATISGAERGL